MATVPAFIALSSTVHATNVVAIWGSSVTHVGRKPFAFSLAIEPDSVGCIRDDKFESSGDDVRLTLDYSGRDRLDQVDTVRGAAEIRTRDGGFADLCLTTWLRRRSEEGIAHPSRPRPGRRNILTSRVGEGKES